MAVIYLDFKKVFDKVPHQRVLIKLQGYGIKGKTLRWIQEFLSNRRQRVVINGSSLDWKPVTSGIPRGSVLGPVLFLVYINDLPDVMNCLKLFADDGKIYSFIKAIQDEKRLQANVRKSEDWAELWDMFYNNKKCKHMRIGKGQPAEPYTMRSGQELTEIEQVKSEKDL